MTKQKKHNSIKRKFNKLNPVNVFKEVSFYGYEVSPKSYITFLIACYAGVIGFGFVFKLTVINVLILVLVATFMLPTVFILQYKNAYEQQRFETATAYMEQMLYSFKKNAKILDSLYDTRLMFDVNEDKVMREVIEEAIAILESGESKANIYQEALGVIEREFDCKRLRKMHNFFIQVEESGGIPKGSIDILLFDRNMWIDRIYDFMMEKKKIRINVSIAIGLAFLITAMAIYMIPAHFGIYAELPSQIATLVTTIVNMLIWYYVQVKLSGSLLAADRNTPYKELKSSYDYIAENKNKKTKPIFFILGAIFSAFGIVTMTALKMKFQGVILLVLGILILTQPGRKLKVCKKRIGKEIEKVFPEWLLAVSLQLQTDNVYVSIGRSIFDAPEILKKPLLKLQQELEYAPGTLTPFVNFLSEFKVTEVTSAMKMLYSLSEYGQDDSEEQISNLINRNTKMMNHAESMKMEDELAGITFAMLIPMIVSTIKILVDLILVMTLVLSSLNV